MLSDEELLQKGKELKDEGNVKFKAKLFNEAKTLYLESISNLNKIKA